MKLVVLKLDGDIEKNGVRVTLEIGSEGEQPQEEIEGKLPAAPQLCTQLNQWQKKYREVGSPARIRPGRITIDGSINDRIQECRESAKRLGSSLTEWLDSDGFRQLDKHLREEINRDENVRVLIRTESQEIQKLPWHLWDFFERYPKAEMALSPYQYKRLQAQRNSCSKPKVRILAILGHSEGIDTTADRQLLENLPNADVKFLVEPQHQEINDQLWEQAWDIIFFAGHSETEQETGRIYINPQDSLTVDELWFGLRKAVEQGLKLAIFNSCDGLGLARDLNDVQIPQMIVMRELVPDRVAQEFLKYFLASFSGGKPFYLAVREARERLQGLESQFPCATWLPVICQHPIDTPPVWEDFFEASLTNDRGFEGRSHPRQASIPWWRGWQKVVLTSIAVTALVMGVRSLGWLQTWELKSYDHLMRSRQPEMIDDRILIVEATEADTNDYKYPLEDSILATAIQNLASYNPRSIGLPMHRYDARGTGRKDLINLFQNNENLMTICAFNSSDRNHAPIAEFSQQQIQKQVGFSNQFLDRDRVIRRQLLSYNPARSSSATLCTSPYSFSFLLATHYLKLEGKSLSLTSKGEWHYEKVVWKKLAAGAGGHFDQDGQSYQILMNYRSPWTQQFIAKTIPLKKVVEGKLDPEWVKDKIVLIGVTAPIAKNNYATPYGEMSGILITAHQVSEILSAVLDGRPLIWTLSQWGDALWVGICALAGGFIAWKVRRSNVLLVITISGLIGIIYYSCYLLLLQGGWMPIFPSVLALIVTVTSLKFCVLHSINKSLN